MEFKGTPNKWQVREGLNLEVIADKTGFGVVCFGSDDELDSCDYPYETALANAKLIAAAPELLEALQYLLKTTTIDRFRCEQQDAIIQANASINKALHP